MNAKLTADFVLLLAIVTLVGCTLTGEQLDSNLAPTPAATQEERFTREPVVANPPQLTAKATTTSSSGQRDNPDNALSVSPSYGYTHQRPDGNRLVSGQGSLPGANVIDIPLSGQPVWIVGAPFPTAANDQATGVGNVSAWAVVMDDDRVQAFIVNGEEVTETAIVPAHAREIPPLLKVADEKLELLMPPSPVYGLAPPAVLDSEGNMAAVSPEGIVTFVDADGEVLFTAESPPLPDGRLLADENGRLLYLSQPTSRYAHGIAGDEIEAAAVTLLEPSAESGGEVIFTLPEPAVIEGIMPLWADLNGDGRREIVVTQSDADQGAQIVVYDESGQQLAEGPAIGVGRRWRHQLAVAPFGPLGEMELVDVLTPHIGGVVEFYQLIDDEMQIVATVPGYTSHVIGSRNLDMALAGDLDGDGQVELLLPNQDRSHLGGIRRTTNGAEVAWTVPLNGRLSTNLAAVQLPGERLIIGAGRDDGTLRLWLPDVPGL